MRTLSFFIIFLIFCSCTSKTIYKKPDNLIPKDTMAYLLEGLLISNGAKNIRNVDFRRKINYHPLVYKKYNIDSSRFETSNFYYTSRIDDYEDIMNTVINSLTKKRDAFFKLKKLNDSIRKDSIQKYKKLNNTKKDSVILILD